MDIEHIDYLLLARTNILSILVFLLSSICIPIPANAGDGINYLHLGNKEYLKGDLKRAMLFYSRADRACDAKDKVCNNKGLVYARRGKYELALEKFQEGMDYNGANPNLYYNRGLVNLTTGEYRAAASDFEESIGLGMAAGSNVAYNCALAYVLDGSYEEANNFLEGIHAEDSQDGKVFELIGMVNYGLKNYDVAARSFAQAYAISDRKVAKYAAALSHYHAGNHALALADLEDLCFHSAQSSEYCNALGNLAKEAGNRPLARDAFSKSLDQDGSNSLALSGLAQYKFENGDVEGAKGLLKKALRTNPDNLQAINALANIAYSKEDWKEAQRLYETSLDKDSTNAETLYGMAQVYMTGLRDPFGCIKYIGKIHTSDLSDDEYERTALLEARALSRINKMREAIDILRKARKRVEDNEEIRTHLAYYYLRLSKFDLAINTIGYGTFDNHRPYLIAGNAALQSREYKTAKKYFNKALQYDSTHQDALNGLALSLVNTKQPRASRQLIDSLYIAHPDNFYVANTKGTIYKDIAIEKKEKARPSNYKDLLKTAEEAFRRAKEIQPGYAKSFDNNRGLTYFHRDLLDEAEELFVAGNNIGGSNNLALLHIKKGKHQYAIQQLDSLSRAYESRYKRPNGYLVNNLALARQYTPMGDVYKFISYFYLHEDLPLLSVDNPFSTYEISAFHFDTAPIKDPILEESAEDCPELKLKSERPSSPKKAKRKGGGKYAGGCPVF